MHAKIICTFLLIKCASYLIKDVIYASIILTKLWKYQSTTLVAPPTVWSCVINVYTERPRVCSIFSTRGRKMEGQENVMILENISICKFAFI